MSNQVEGYGPTTFAERTLAESSAHIADAVRQSGGASAAAICAAHAAATGQLVARLNSRRKRNPEWAALSLENANSLERDRAALFEMADGDAAILTDLMRAHSTRKASATDRARYLDALSRAAQSSLELAEAMELLLLKLAAEAERTPLFLVSDIGAATSICSGALQATLFTAIANVQFLFEDGAGEGSHDFISRIERLWTMSEERGAGVNSSILSRYSVMEGVDPR